MLTYGFSSTSSSDVEGKYECSTGVVLRCGDSAGAASALYGASLRVLCDDRIRLDHATRLQLDEVRSEEIFTEMQGRRCSVMHSLQPVESAASWRRM